jgi:hypothetical protein
MRLDILEVAVLDHKAWGKRCVISQFYTKSSLHLHLLKMR